MHNDALVNGQAGRKGSFEMKATSLLRSLFAGAAFAAFLTPPLHAATLLEYTFAGGSAAPATQDAGVTGSNAAWTGLSGAGFSSSTNTAYAPANVVPASFNSGRYLQFTITADPGFTLNLDTLDFRMGGQNTSNTLAYEVDANVRSGKDGFGSDLTINPGAVTTATDTVAAGDNTSFSDFSVDLSGVAFDNLTTLTFRLYPIDSSDSTGNFYRYDTITLNGTVAPIPEPTAAALLTLSLMGLLLFRRLPFQTGFAK